MPLLRRPDDLARHLAIWAGASSPVRERHLMIVPNASGTGSSTPTAMRAGMRAFGPPHTAGRNEPGDGQRCDDPECNHRQSSLANDVVTRHHRTPVGLQKLVPEDPGRPFQLQSP